MIIVRNNILPIKGFKAMALWPFTFVRKNAIFGKVAENHENIHGAQQLEMLVVGAILAGILAIIGCGWWSLFALPLFFYWYGIEWAIRKLFTKQDAYKSLAHEREAYDNEENLHYLDERKLFAWVKYLK